MQHDVALTPATKKLWENRQQSIRYQPTDKQIADDFRAESSLVHMRRPDGFSNSNLISTNSKIEG